MRGDEYFPFVNEHVHVGAHLICQIQPLQLLLPDSLDEGLEARLEGSRRYHLDAVDIKRGRGLDLDVLVSCCLILSCRLNSGVREGVWDQTWDYFVDSTQTVLWNQLVDHLVVIEIFDVECELASCFQTLAIGSPELNISRRSLYNVYAHGARGHREDVANRISTRGSRNQALNLASNYALHH